MTRVEPHILRRAQRCLGSGKRSKKPRHQLTSAGATGLSYDGRGNLINSGSDAFSYTSENRLATAPSGAGK